MQTVVTSRPRKEIVLKQSSEIWFHFIFQTEHTVLTKGLGFFHCCFPSVLRNNIKIMPPHKEILFPGFWFFFFSCVCFGDFLPKWRPLLNKYIKLLKIFALSPAAVPYWLSAFPHACHFAAGVGSPARLCFPDVLWQGDGVTPRPPQPDSSPADRTMEVLTPACSAKGKGEQEEAGDSSQETSQPHSQPKYLYVGQNSRALGSFAASQRFSRQRIGGPDPVPQLHLCFALCTTACL